MQRWSLTPELDQGETDANPRPDPSATRISELEAATTAPEMIAGNDTADIDASIVAPVPPTP